MSPFQRTSRYVPEPVPSGFLLLTPELYRYPPGSLVMSPTSKLPVQKPDVPGPLVESKYSVLSTGPGSCPQTPLLISHTGSQTRGDDRPTGPLTETVETGYGTYGG